MSQDNFQQKDHDLENTEKTGEDIKPLIPKWVLGILLVVTVGACFILPWYLTYAAGKEIYDLSNDGEIGDTIGGITAPVIGIFTIILIFLTYDTQSNALSVQKRELEAQRSQLRKTQESAGKQAETLAQQQFENTFFELLRIHRENVEQIKSDKQVGKTAFISMHDKLSEIYKKAMYDKDVKNPFNSYRNSLNEETVLQIAYLIFYFGKDQAFDYLTKEGFTSYIDYNGLWQFIDQFTTSSNASGQHSNLSNYFRHLYQIFIFVDENSAYLQGKEGDKKFYLKKIRAQLSPYELAIFFANSLTPLGEKWEWMEIQG